MTAHDESRRAGATGRIESPGFLIGASGQAHQRARREGAAAKTNEQRVKLLRQRGEGI
jgi:hypothetical protein